MKRTTGAFCALLAIGALLPAACTGSDPAVDRAADWRGSITTEGNVTTVINESGSVWGAPARLVEEASIGVESGADEYMLGEVFGIAATSDSIYVIDRQVPAVRVYDTNGSFLRNLGGPGEGPGEFQRPASIVVDPAGRVLLRDDRARRILIYAAQGDYLGAYPMTGGINTSTPMTLVDNEVPYTIVFVGLRQDDPHRVFDLGMQAHGPDGPFGELIMQPVDDSFVPAVVSSADGSIQRPVPFAPEEVWALTRGLDVVFGVSSAYRFEIRRRDGSLLVVHRSVPAVVVDAEEAAWRRAEATAIMRDLIPEWIWNGIDIPATKPPFAAFIPAASGEIWVRRPGPGIALPDCNLDAVTSNEFDGDPCWAENSLLDVFGADGRYLGAVEVPPDMRFAPRPVIDGTSVVARTESDDGTIRVKRYRLDIPD